MNIELEHHGRRYRATVFVYRDRIAVESHYGRTSAPREGDPTGQAEQLFRGIIDAWRDFYSV